MRLAPLYGTTYRPPRRGHFFKKSVRWTVFVGVAMAILYLVIQGYIAALPMAERLILRIGQ